MTVRLITNKTEGMPRWMGWVGAGWGVLGVVTILVSAVLRLAPIGFEPLAGEITVGLLVGYAVSVIFFAYTEGYRAFHLHFSPRVAARAHHLVEAPTPLRLVAAPLFCMGYFGATRRRMISSWAVTLGVVGIILAVKFVPQPWRGAIDLGVCIALLWGAAVIPYYFLRGVVTREFPVPADVPSGSLPST